MSKESVEIVAAATPPAVHHDRAAVPARKRDVVELFELKIDNLTMDGLCERLEAMVREEQPGYVVTPNVNHVCLCQRDAAFRESYEHASLRLVDGTPIIWASYLFGEPLHQKLSGSDLVPWLSRWASHKGYSVFFFGGTPGTADETARILQERNPHLRIAGTYCPPYGFDQDAAENEKGLAALQASNADLCFVALGSPKQELWMRKHVEAAGIPVLIGVGAAFDFMAGRIKRAPVWLQRSGMEWLWRLSQEPRRLWRRYILEDSMILKLVCREGLRRLRRRFQRA